MEKLSEVPSPTEKNTLSPDLWEAAYLRLKLQNRKFKSLSRASLDSALLNGRVTPKLSSFLRPRQRLGRSRSPRLHPHRGVDLSPRLIALFKGSANAPSRIAENFLSPRAAKTSSSSKAACTISRVAPRSRSDFLGNAACASNQRPRHVRRAVAPLPSSP